MVKVHRSIPDGSCLFRSLSTSLLYSYGGICCTGAPWGEEATLGELAHNVVARWIRCLVVHYLGVSMRTTVSTRIGNTSLNSVLFTLTCLLEKYGARARFADAAYKQSMVRRFVPGPFAITATGNELVPTFDLPLEQVVGGSIEHYCRSMLQDDVWGGEIEAFAASRVLALPVEIRKTKKNVDQRYSVDNRVSHVLRLLYTQNNHYDAILNHDGPPPLLTVERSARN